MQAVLFLLLVGADQVPPREVAPAAPADHFHPVAAALRHRRSACPPVAGGGMRRN